MFENQQEEVEVLMHRNAEFRSLYLKHRELDRQVRDAEIGLLPLPDLALAQMKKEKLWAKDKLTHIWDCRHRAA